MFSPETCLWLIPLLPLLGSVAIAAVGRRYFPDRCHVPCIAAALGSCVLALGALAAVLSSETPIRFGREIAWIHAGNFSANFSLRADGLTAVMLVMVTFIGSLIAIYSAGYMEVNDSYPRYFAAVSAFLFFMTGLVLANNFVLLYACWEGVGLCSYLLIGFWFERPSAAAAARKAFLVTRLGDIGLFIGILILWHNFGHSLEYDDVFANVKAQFDAGVLDHGVLFWACVCLFLGAAGKSAQFPLHVWLPDAMEGPSPVSALIHAATMVTAGVYLVARCTPLFGLEPDAQLLVAGIGGFTALLAALIAVTQTDLKRVLAYSTLSQLGFMFLALGSGVVVGEHKLAGLAVTAAIFHLFTHAFFKALLFLGAGSVMHSMHDVIDMTKFGGLKKVLPTTHWTFLCGAAALAGVPLLSGFWSKDEILATTYDAWHATRGAASGIYCLLFFSALFTAGLTAFYTARAYFMTFHGEEKLPPEAGEHPHDAPPIMAWPLMILAVGAVGVGIVLGPTHLFAWILETRWITPQFAHLASPHSANWLMMIASSVIALAGVGIAYWLYVADPSIAASMATLMTSLYEASRGKFYFDEIYELAIVLPMNVCSHVCRVVDLYLLDGLVDLLGQVPAVIGYLVRPVQNGLVQFYALLMALGLAGFLLSVLLR
ncbi:MAG: NADH-quinone oxidoreductase subunit L [Planctomycetes bacterium]|nr:NADH-quinone oxidoreductase subunit L [Planctomycetota bacterium]